MGKRLASIGVAAAIAVGGLAVAAANPFQVAGASSSSTSSSASTAAGATRNGPIAQALRELVANHTITQDQAVKIAAQIKADAKADVSKAKANRKANRQQILAVVATSLGETPQQVMAGLKDGQTIAQQAQAKAVPIQTVSTAVTNAITDRLNQAVTAGKLTQARATKIEARLPTLVGRLLNADAKQLRRAAARFGGL